MRKGKSILGSVQIDSEMLAFQSNDRENKK